MNRDPRRALGVMVCLALLVRLAWAFYLPNDRASLADLPDQVEYLTLADHLLHGQGLFFEDPRFQQSVHAYRMPGYPTFIAALGAGPRSVRVVQSIIDTLNVLAVWIIARRALGAGRPWACLLAGALVAFNPYLVYLSGLVLSESLYAALLIWSIVPLVSVGQPLRRRALAWSILPLIASVYVRPSGMPLAIILPCLAIWVNGKNLRLGRAYVWSRALTAALAVTVLLILALLPWAYRNHRVVSAWVWTTTNAGVTAYDGWNPHATGASDQSMLASMPELQHMGEVERSNYLRQKADTFVREHPARSLRLALRKLVRTWSLFPLSDALGSKVIYVLVGAGFTLPFFVLAWIGLGRGTLSGPLKALCWTPAVYFTLVHMLSVGSLRYRIPAEPPLAVLAGAAVARRNPSEARIIRAEL